MSAAYYAKGMEIWKSPVATQNGDGTTSISIGFQCATATEIVGEEGAQAIAEMLTLTADSAGLTAEASARIAALSEENERLRTALENMLKRYVDLAGSGDSGFWDPEDEDEVKASRAALEDRT